MRKICMLACVVGVLGFSACKEKGPAIDFGGTAVASDTTYITTVPPAQQRVVLVEEFTGATCPNCPDARDQLTAIAGQHNGQVVPIEIHINNFIQSRPAEGAKYDLRTEDGTNIASTFYTVDAMPSAGINRVQVGQSRLLYKGDWANAINTQVGIAPLANVDVKSTFNATTRTATIKVTVTYIKPVSQKQYLTLAVLEDNIVDIQEYPDHFDNNYSFKHTLRDIVTAVGGDEFLKDASQKEAGRVYERTFIYPVDSKWNENNCKVVAFVHNNDATSKEVLQAAETDLKGQ